MLEDPDCICKGNWRLIIKEHEHLFDRNYKCVQGRKEDLGKIWSLTGVLWASDDLYYSMWSEGKTLLLSCVGSIEMQGFELMPRPEGCTCKDGPDGCLADCNGRYCGCQLCLPAWRKKRDFDSTEN